MSPRPDPGRGAGEQASRRAGEGHSALPDSALGTQPSALSGLLGAAEATRGGEDTRRRGWFWHWNSIVTQYAPLIGLKGVGLLNSYTVWTDRREESPHRGYAFPSQQSEADFYGEDRAELITINKILVALDLIEIRKEMVLRTDERGRRWRVPHNFYRVKDHSDDFTLSGRDVLRVVELADRDQAVYRYVRRIFSPRFAPIDGENVWVRILAEIRSTDAWQRLAARTEREEDRASARTRAGHAARRGGTVPPTDRDNATTGRASNDSADVAYGEGDRTSVATINNGRRTIVGGVNNGSTTESPTSVAPSNAGLATAVGPTNTTYDQNELTTTTTNDGSARKIESAPDPPVDGDIAAAAATLEPTPHAVEVSAAIGPGDRPAPADAAGESAAIRAFEDANGRRSSSVERQLLAALAERFDPAAREQARPGPATGWAWVAAAIYDAVAAGSTYVAPRRLREILTRWEREGLPGEEAARRQGGEAPRATQFSTPAPTRIPLGDAPDFSLPHGFGSRRTWEFTVSLLAGAVDRGRLPELVAGTAIVGYRDGEVTIAAPRVGQAERLAGEYRELVARKLSEAMRRPVRLAVLTAVPDELGHPVASLPPALPAPLPPAPVAGGRDEEPAPPSFIVAECGLPNGQLWAAVLEELRTSGDVGRANYDTWLRGTALIGRGDGGSLVVGVPHALAQRRVASRFAPQLRAAVATIVGVPLPIEVVVARDWRRAQPFRASQSAASPTAERQQAGA